MSTHQELRDAIGAVVVLDFVKNYVEVTVDALRLADLLGEFDAIAPPVAAGSVDTPAFRNMLATWSGHNEDWRIRHASESMDGIIAHINAWGAQQHEAGYHEGVAQLRHERDSLLKLANERQERAEKAEADLKARDFFVDVLNCQVKKAQDEADVLFHRLNAANGHLAMARERIEELEAEIKVLHQG